MSGILNKKQRVMDFSLTRNGYEQVQNGDLRIRYATFTDRDAIYENEEKTIDIADPLAMPFMFEAFNTKNDVLNYEFDLSPDRSIKDYINGTNIQNSYVNISNSDIVSSSIINDSFLFESLTNIVNSNINDHCLILTDNFTSFDSVTNQNKDIDLRINKINEIENTILSLNEADISYDLNDQSYLTLADVAGYLNSSESDFLHDSRLMNKLPFLFLPPSNMNTDVASKNEKIKNSYNISRDRRDKKKMLYKNMKNPGTLNLANIKNFSYTIKENEDIDTILDNLVQNIETMSKTKITSENSEIDNPSKIWSIELTFDQIERDSPFMFQFYESIIRNTSNTKSFNKLVVIDQGEFYSKKKQKNIQVFLVGKLYNSKYEIEEVNNNYITEDDYMFVNLFTMVLE